MRRRGGFTLIELLVAMTVFIFVIAAASTLFTSLLTQFKQQSRVAETQIEGIIGLELLRRDIKHAGYGLPWDMNGGTYTEAGVDGNTLWIDRDFNDGPPINAATHPARGTDIAGASNAPGAIRSNDVGLYGSDVLVLKGTNFARNDASQKWTRLGYGDAATGPVIREDVGSGDDFGDFVSSDRVIVIAPSMGRRLVRSDSADAASWRITYNTVSTVFDPDLFVSPTTEEKKLEINLVYGIKPAPVGGGAVSPTDPSMPFNRVDYYVRIPAGAVNMPNQCAQGTGILYRGEVIHSNGLHTELPVFDCVADFQVGYTDNNGVIQDQDYTYTLTAAEIRDQIRTVTVSILAQDGQKDPTNCTVANPCITNPVLVGPDATRGRNFNFNTIPALNTATNRWQNFHWKVYIFTVTMENLGR